MATKLTACYRWMSKTEAIKSHSQRLLMVQKQKDSNSEKMPSAQPSHQLASISTDGHHFPLIPVCHITDQLYTSIYNGNNTLREQISDFSLQQQNSNMKVSMFGCCLFVKALRGVILIYKIVAKWQSAHNQHSMSKTDIFMQVDWWKTWGLPWNTDL